MEEDLKISQIEYLSSRWSDFPQVLTFNLGEQTKIKKNEMKMLWKKTAKYQKLNILATTNQILLKF